MVTIRVSSSIEKPVLSPNPLFSQPSGVMTSPGPLPSTYLVGIPLIRDRIVKADAKLVHFPSFALLPNFISGSLIITSSFLFGREVLKFVDYTTQIKKENNTHSMYSQSIVRNSSSISKYSKDILTKNESDYILSHQGDRYERLLNNMEFI